MRQSICFTVFVGMILLLSIKSNDIEIEPILKATNAQYSLNDILDAATRVKNYVLKNKKLPKLFKFI